MTLGDAEMKAALHEVLENLDRRNEKHGSAPHSTIHETLGVLVEEMDEFKVEVRGEDHFRQYAELCDVATAAIVGMASLAGRM